MSKIKRDTFVWDCECDYPKCGHKWTTKGEAVPEVCAKCKRRDWDKNGIIKTVVAIDEASSNELLEVSNIGRLPVERRNTDNDFGEDYGELSRYRLNKIKKQSPISKDEPTFEERQAEFEMDSASEDFEVDYNPADFEV